MFFKPRKKKAFVIGLDCAPPRLLFDKFKDELPNFKMMLDKGVHCPMRSVHPPITIPAWMSMCSGLDVGEIGVYGFRTRKDNSYTEFDISTSKKFSQIDKIWDILAKLKKKSVLVGVPPSYPTYHIDGGMISGFICPDAASNFTYPESLKGEIEELVGEYKLDVVFRTEDRDKLIKSAWEMTEKRFKVIEYLIKNKQWDFFMFVEIGVDRIQHAFWKYYDPSHHLYQPEHKYKNVIFDYYKFIDQKVGKILSVLDKDTTVFTVSDHGAKSMKGVFCLNEWLIDKGYLVLNKYPDKIASFNQLDVDWQKTRAWGWGGHCGRIFINKKNRETQGLVRDSEYESLRDGLIKELENETDPLGKPWNTKVYKPKDVYKVLNGTPSDLVAYFDDLAYRGAGTVGHKKIFLEENDTGPDDAAHDWQGVFIEYSPLSKSAEELNQISILDFKDRVLKSMGI
ncbi:MAG: alkaline phosphatase family protein [Candidatus Omnitrophica bacterium]|nr:alkaline phosphatase family protein [Candidatus Omnitrophota bacterium]